MNKRKGHEPSLAIVRRFAAKQATPAERAAVLDHLLAGCAVCQRRLRLAGWHGPDREAALSPGRKAAPGLPAGAYDEAFAAADRAAQVALERKHIPAQQLLAELDRLPAEQQELRVRNLRRYASPTLAAAYIERSHAARYGDHEELLRCARLAVAAAEAATPPDAGGRSLLADCRAQAWGQLANAHRIRGHMLDAEREFATALRLADEGTGDLALRAWLYKRLSSLRMFQRDYAAAAAALDTARDLYRRLHDRAGEADALIKWGLATIIAGKPKPAIEPLHRALSLLTPQNIELLRAATQNLVYCYLELGEPKHAYNLMADAEPHFLTCTDELVLLRVNWLRGKIERDLGLFDAAEIRLTRVREAFERQRLPFAVAVVSLDLAEVYAQERRVPELVGTVGETIPIFQGLGVTRDLLAALLKLQEIGHQTVAAVALVRQILAQLKAGLPQAPHPAALDAVG